ncbi:MAG: transglycosylase domain-containing protein [Bacteroidetes bacterium]|nr:transglycosylase domain-containing protein [Bacteroidota bacterium]
MRGVKKKTRRPFIQRFWIFYFSLLAFLFFLFVVISLGGFGFMPSLEELENPKSNLASEIISSDQKVIGKYFIENRSNIHYNDLSPHLVNALIATEDIRFKDHSGVDIKAMGRVILGIVTFSHKGGGSTITQQLAKNLFPRDDHSFFLKTMIVKLKEWVTAIRLERNYSKEEIIALYFNTVPFGSATYGIKSAAKTFYNKEPKDLTIEEAALMVGVLKAPSWYSPVRNMERAMKRREVVLSQMEKYNFITESQYDSLRGLPIDMSHYRLQDQNSGPATYFREYLRNYLVDWCEQHKKPDGNSYNLYKDGLKIYATINSRMQEYAEIAVTEHLGKDLQPAFFKHWKGYKNAPFDRNLTQTDINLIMKQAVERSDRYLRMKRNNATDEEIDKAFHTKTSMSVFTWKGERDTVMTPMDSIRYYKYFLLTGLMSVEPQTGFVRAYVGGIDYKYFKYDHVKLGRRQVGSTFKPFLYTLAMQEGEFTPCTKVPNIPVSFDLPDGSIWTPANAENDDNGKMVTLKYALANSINYVSAYLMKRYSPLSVINLVRKMGITSPIDPVPSICLGTPDISVYEMTGAMGTYANKGLYIEPIFITRIEDKFGNVLTNFIPRQEEAMNEQTAYLMISLMKGVVESGTGIRLRYKYGLSFPIAGKTGTTSNYSDGWFMGLTPNLVTGIWVGFEDRSVHFRNMTLGQGANMALPIWGLYMQQVYKDATLDFPREDFEKPQNFSVSLDCDKFQPPKNQEDFLEGFGN